MEHDLRCKFNGGESVGSNEFVNGGLEFFADVVHPMWKQDQVRKEPDLWGEIWYQRVTPLIELTPEQIHLLRPADTREGRRIMEAQKL